MIYAACFRRHAVVRVSAKWMLSMFVGTVFDIREGEVHVALFNFD